MTDIELKEEKGKDKRYEPPVFMWLNELDTARGTCSTGPSNVGCFSGPGDLVECFNGDGNPV